MLSLEVIPELEGAQRPGCSVGANFEALCRVSHNSSDNWRLITGAEGQMPSPSLLTHWG